MTRVPHNHHITGVELPGRARPRGCTVTTVPTTSSPCPLPDADLRRLTPADAGQVTVLQRACWVEEAIVNGTLDIAPLTETPDEVAEWLGSTEALGLWLGGRLVGLIRGRRAGDTWEISRIAVVPDLRGRHLGWWLMEQIESRAPAGCTRYELFTGSKSLRNISLYERRGYRRMPVSRPGLVYLDKPIAR
ncbi:MAG TPA: GNAT family N-acetyltransferase [Propionibacteriaceae bacterium]|nr:GNAT family N-acetyltransferase [Propionibacteriaceae bacterium]